MSFNRTAVVQELIDISKLLMAKKGEVPEAFKKQWKNKDKDGDGKENEPKPDFLKKKEEKKGSRSREATPLQTVASAFARYCVGDRDTAIAGLKMMKGKNFEGEGLSEMVDTGEYTAVFEGLYSDILRALKKTLPV